MSTVIIPERLALLEALTIDKSSHKNFEEGHCALELVSWLSGESWSDHPDCVSPVIGDFCRNWNDNLNDIDRQQLKPYLVRLVGSKGNRALELRRLWMATNWLARECGPAFMDMTPALAEHAKALRALPEITDKGSVNASLTVLDAARAAAYTAAWAAAGAAVGAATYAAAWDAAGAAAGAAAYAATYAAAWAATYAAGGAAAGAWAAAGAAAWAATWRAAWAAGGAAAYDATRAAAYDATWAALASTVAHLQESAFALLDRMLEAV